MTRHATGSPPIAAAARLVEAIDEMLKLAEQVKVCGWPERHPTEDDYLPLNELHAKAVGLAAAAGLPSPPPMHESGLGLYAIDQEFANVVGVAAAAGMELGSGDGKLPVAYAPVRPPSRTLQLAWTDTMQSLRTAAAAMASAEDITNAAGNGPKGRAAAAKITKQAMAVGLLYSRREIADWTDAKLAAELNVHVKSIPRWKAFKELRERVRQGRPLPRRHQSGNDPVEEE